MVAAIFIPNVVFAEVRTTDFSLSMKAEIAVPDQKLEVTLNGNNLNGLYAYEALITYDPKQVEFDKAESRLKGFFIPPKIDNGRMMIAFTHIGNKSGEQGNTVLSNIVFKGKARGDAKIKLAYVKALDPKLTATTFIYTIFNDLSGYDWAKKEIESLMVSGIIKGISATTFNPGANITRADFISLLIRALKLSATVDGNFNDIKQSDYYYKEVGIAKKLGIAQGLEDNRFEPKKSISRQDMMVLAARAMKISGKPLDESASDLSHFSDSGEVATYAARQLGQMAKEGIIKGDNGMIKPNGKAIRAEAAVIIYRIMNN